MHDKKPNGFLNLWKGNGRYAILTLCAVAVGIAGYFLVNGGREQKEPYQQALSVPVTVEDPKADPLPKEESKVSANEVQETAQVPVEDVACVVPVSGSVLQDYAMDRLVYHGTTRDWRVHNGVDLAAEVGAPVKAAKAGTITAVYEDEFMGTTVVVQHDNGYTSHYCGLNPSVCVNAGDIVSAGTILGSVSESVLLESEHGPHLHFEVYQNGQSVDPAGFLY